jgi:hypothetical protein
MQLEKQILEEDFWRQFILPLIKKAVASGVGLLISLV